MSVTADVTLFIIFSLLPPSREAPYKGTACFYLSNFIETSRSAVGEKYIEYLNNNLITIKYYNKCAVI